MESSWTLQELVAEVATRIAALPPPRNGQVRAIPDDRTVRYYATIGLLDRPSAMRGRTALYGRKHVAQVVAIKRLQATGRSLSEIQTLWPTLDDLTLARMSGVALEAKGKASARAGFWKREPKPSVAADAGAAGFVEDAADTGAAGLVEDAADTGAAGLVGDAADAGAAGLVGDAADAGVAGAVGDAADAGVAGAVGDAADAGAASTVEDAAAVGAAREVAGAPVVPAGDAVAPATLPSASAAVDLRVKLAPNRVAVQVPSLPPAAVELRVKLAPNVVLSLSVVDESCAITPADVRALRAAAAPLLAELASRRIAPHARGEEP